MHAQSYCSIQLSYQMTNVVSKDMFEDFAAKSAYRDGCNQGDSTAETLNHHGPVAPCWMPKSL